ncbi:unnamed protein product [Prunus armeniaca]|uniref:Protein-tyrosine-phosphatase MKP1 C-terminal domain-containing protein n=1 Tax=Prunus armeniaca TaxID=36596 RepID=A0A6J5U6G5_PRUAR|nr:unnamed protein product [Prunus armeniaca]
MYLLIVHIPSAIYVWIGKNCEAIMERDARGAVCQIVRYERVQGPITIIKEGEEPAYSWDAFSNIFPLMDKSGNGGEVGESTVKIHPGERKTDGYNVDFEIFQKAIRGSFVPPFASSENEHETHLPARESSWSMLRRKFASGNMKEFVLAPRISLSRVYSDSMMLVHTAKIIHQRPSSSSSSSSSPLYLSPDSISSESSTSSKYFQNPLWILPSAASCSLPVSSTLSNDSDMSLLSSKSSDQPMSNSPENVVSNCSSQSYSRSTSLPSKKLSPLAERRGSLSLKLPVMSDKMRLMSTSSKFLSTKEDGVRINDSTCSVGHIDDIDKVLEPKDGVQKGGEYSRQQCNICQKEPSFIKHSAEPWKNFPLEEGAGSSASKETGESCPAQCNFMQPFVCRWPSLEKIATFGVRELDSKSSFTIYSPNTGVGKSERQCFVSLGRKIFHCGNFPIQLDSGRERTDVEETDWDINLSLLRPIS